MTRGDLVRRSLAASWWMLFPAFALLVARLGYERRCADAFDLLPALMTRPLVAVIVAAVYLAAYIWCAAAYFVSVRRSGRFFPPPRELRRIWQADSFKVAAFFAVLAVEQFPRSVWTAVLGRVWRC